MKIIAALALVAFPFAVNAQDMQQYLQDTHKLVDAGKYKEALDRDIWFHDHALEKNKAMVGVRLSFALNDWKALGDKYPPALKALQDIRDKKTKLVFANGNQSNLFADVAAINRTLSQDSKTVDLFKAVIKTHPDAGQSCWYSAKEPLFAAKDYQTIKKYIGDPLTEFNAIKQRYDRSLTVSAKMPGQAVGMYKELTKRNFVNSNVQLIQYAMAVNDIKSAKEIQQKASVVVKSDLLDAAIRK